MRVPHVHLITVALVNRELVSVLLVVVTNSANTPTVLLMLMVSLKTTMMRALMALLMLLMVPITTAIRLIASVMKKIPVKLIIMKVWIMVLTTITKLASTYADIVHAADCMQYC